MSISGDASDVDLATVAHGEYEIPSTRSGEQKEGKSRPTVAKGFELARNKGTCAGTKGPCAHSPWRDALSRRGI